MKTRCVILVLAALTLPRAAARAEPFTPSPHAPVEGEWVFQPRLSDEFDGPELDLDKWNTTPKSWGVWSWSPDNAFVQGGSLRIRTRYEPHTRAGQPLFFKSGIARTREKILYGYFEARIKAADIEPGKISPAFWLTDQNREAWIELDIVELIEVPRDPRVAKTNTHIFRHPRLAADRPGARLNAQANRWELHEQHAVTLGFDPREDFHIYACLWDRDEIRWYVDGRLVRTRANDYWDGVQDVIFSTGLREELRRNTVNPSPEGFPAEFEVDYVRVWQRASDRP